MGKPISSKGRFPFGSTGVVVDALKLADGSTQTSAFVIKQRSSHRYTLGKGVSVFDYLTITDTDKNGAKLDFTKSASALASDLAPGTFCMKAYKAGVAVGFILEIQLNKVITFDGSVIFDYDFTSGQPVAVTGVTLNKASTNIAVGANETLVATVAPATATNKAVTWSTSDATKATVDSTGKVVGVAAGTVTITVTTTDGSKTATCAVTIA